MLQSVYSGFLKALKEINAAWLNETDKQGRDGVLVSAVDTLSDHVRNLGKHTRKLAPQVYERHEEMLTDIETIYQPRNDFTY